MKTTNSKSRLERRKKDMKTKRWTKTLLLNHQKALFGCIKRRFRSLYQQTGREILGSSISRMRMCEKVNSAIQKAYNQLFCEICCILYLQRGSSVALISIVV